MALKYYADRITGLSGDTKPSNVEEGKVFFETDTKITYRYISSTWTADPAATNPGTISPWGGSYTAVPSGWLLCDGAAVSRTTYADLFAVIGTYYGVGDGSTTFNLPELRDKFPRGASACTNPGGTGGEDAVTLTTCKIPSHSHTVSDSGHSHCLAGLAGNSGGASLPRYGSCVGNPSNKATNNASSGISIATSGGGGQSHNNIPSYVAATFIIKT